MSTDPSTRTAEARPDDLCNVRVYGEDDFPCCAPRSNHRHHDPLGDETEPAHSIQVGAYEPEGLSCSCGFTPRGEGSHALTNHLTRAATAEMSARVAVLEGQLAEVRKHQIGMARGFIHNAESERKRAGEFQWTKHHSAAAAEGWAHGAVQTLQMLLMELGEVEYDEAAETTWDVVTSEGATDVR